MDFDFWDNCWQRESQPFHVAQTHPLLVKHIHRFDKSQRLLLPLSGKSVDPIYLSSQGISSTSIEFNPKAVQAFITENRLVPQLKVIADAKQFQFNHFDVWQADFFELNQALIGSFPQVFDRAALVALPEELQERYALHLQSLLTKNATIFMVTMDYDANEMSGPPFLINKNQLQNYFPRSEIIELDRNSLIDNHPRWKELELSFLDEVLYQISL